MAKHRSHSNIVLPALMDVVNCELRLEILRRIAERKEAWVGEVTALIDDSLPPDLVSYHLRLLQSAELVTGRRVGNKRMYAATDRVRINKAGKMVVKDLGGNEVHFARNVFEVPTITANGAA